MIVVTGMIVRGSFLAVVIRFHNAHFGVIAMRLTGNVIFGDDIGIGVFFGSGLLFTSGFGFLGRCLFSRRFLGCFFLGCFCFSWRFLSNSFFDLCHRLSNFLFHSLWLRFRFTGGLSRGFYLGNWITDLDRRAVRNKILH